KTVLPLATGGSPHHMLALDYALRPVLQSLGAKHILPGIYATDSQVTVTPEGAYEVHADIAARLDDAVNVLITESLRPSQAHAGRFAPIPFSQVRCSV
ncbi:MAG TPA: FMN reductase (NADPH), partial [Acidovorax sp.]